MRELVNAITVRKINYYSIIAVGIIYSLNKWYFKNFTKDMLQKFCRCYLNDLICPLFFLGVVQIIMIWIGKEIKSIYLYGFIAIVMSIIWEYFAPIINKKSVTDKWDIGCYFFGTILYYIFWKIEIGSKSANKSRFFALLDSCAESKDN